MLSQKTKDKIDELVYRAVNVLVESDAIDIEDLDAVTRLLNAIGPQQTTVNIDGGVFSVDASSDSKEVERKIKETLLKEFDPYEAR